MFNGLVYYRKAFALFTLMLLTLSPSIFSNNLSAATPWTGFFIGGYSGIAHDNTNLSTDAGSLSNLPYFQSNANIASVNQNGSASIQHNNFIIGTELGYNRQYQQLVYGVETDFGYLGIQSSKQSNNITYPTAAAAYTMNVAMNTSWLLTTRINIGITPSSFREWIYLTGGLALTEMQVSNSFSDNATSAGRESAQNNQVQAGWALGTGIKVHGGTHWLIGFEYLFVQFNNATASGKVICTDGGGVCPANTNSPLDTSAKFYASLAKLSVDYLF